MKENIGIIVAVAVTLWLVNWALAWQWGLSIQWVAAAYIEEAALALLMIGAVKWYQRGKTK